MSVDCGSCVAKYLLCLFNFAFFILGSVILGVGIWVAADKSSFIALLKLVENEHVTKFTQPVVIEQMAYVLIACGILMFLLSFLGYVGAIRESSCMLTTYATFMIIIVIVQLTVGGLAAIYKNNARVETGNFLRSTITRYYNSDGQPDAVNLVWYQLMTDMHCCGVHDYRDFETAAKWNATRGDRIVPEQCCKRLQPDASNTTAAGSDLLEADCPQRPTELNSYYMTGCYEKVLGWVMHNRNIIIYSTVGIGVAELLLIFLSCCLSSNINKYRVMRL